MGHLVDLLPGKVDKLHVRYAIRVVVSQPMVG